MIDPAILILDDALSAVDTYTEEEILSRLRGVMRQRTSIIVSHRISTVRDADQIFVLHDGRIAERGTARRSSSRTTASTRRCTGSSCWKRSCRRRRASGRASRLATSHLDMSTHDEDVVGKAYDARLMRRLLGYLRPYRLHAALALAAIIANSMLQLAQPYLMKLAIDRYIPAGDLAGVNRIALWYFAHPRRRLLPRVHPDLAAADDRAADHVRHAHADLPAPAAPRPAVLRSQPGRPADDAGHDRRRRAQRPVHLRRRLDLRRRLHARRHHDRDADDELAAGAGRVRGAAADRPGDAVVPAPRARVVPDRAAPDRADQRLPAGAHHRHGDGAAVPPRGRAPTRAFEEINRSTATPTSTRSSTTPCSIRRSR